ncbi:hypothetical protein AB1Y20_015485 [Prymnesium parvum]|uniref:Uncharacterized protein n=1 Tax=Prymnesium parvum TaxID=97485 RepID=A0AB34JYI8_PRYPA
MRRNLTVHLPEREAANPARCLRPDLSPRKAPYSTAGGTSPKLGEAEMLHQRVQLSSAAYLDLQDKLSQRPGRGDLASPQPRKTSSGPASPNRSMAHFQSCCSPGARVSPRSPHAMRVDPRLLVRRLPSVDISDGDSELGSFSPLPRDILEQSQPTSLHAAAQSSVRTENDGMQGDARQPASSWPTSAEYVRPSRDDTERECAWLREALEQSNAEREALAEQLKQAHERAAQAVEEADRRLRVEVERIEAKFRREMEHVRRGADAATLERDKALKQARALQERAVAWAVRDTTDRVSRAEQERFKEAEAAHAAALEKESGRTRRLEAQLHELQQTLSSAATSSESHPTDDSPDMNTASQRLADEVLRIAHLALWRTSDLPSKDVGWQVEDARRYLSSLTLNDIRYAS